MANFYIDQYSWKNICFRKCCEWLFIYLSITSLLPIFLFSSLTKNNVMYFSDKNMKTKLIKNSNFLLTSKRVNLIRNDIILLNDWKWTQLWYLAYFHQMLMKSWWHIPWEKPSACTVKKPGILDIDCACVHLWDTVFRFWIYLFQRCQRNKFLEIS